MKQPQGRMTTVKMLQVTMLVAIMTLMALVPLLGYIPLTPTIRATTLHLPVIIGAVLLGPRVGAFLGAVFGLTSLLSNTFSPTVTSFVFSPFYQVGEIGGNAWSLVICFVPRILLGVVAGWVFLLLRERVKHQTLSCAVAAVAGSLTNTILVLWGIYLFFGDAYAAVKEIPYDLLVSVLIGIVAVNGVLEAIVAAILCTVVTRPLLGRQNRREP